MNAGNLHRRAGDVEPVGTDWGRIVWLADGAQMPGAEQTFGLVWIDPGRQNPLHLHPNCEELLYVVSGACEHRVGEEVLHLLPGSILRIPRGVPHQARCSGDAPLHAVISFSAGDRQTRTLEADMLPER